MPDSDLDNRLLEAAGRCSLPTLQFLLALGADINTRNATGQTPLLRVVRRGRERAPALVRWLLAQGADIKAADRHDLTALHIAAQQADPATVEALLDAGADPDALARHGRPPLWYAIEARSVTVADLLLERGANPNIQPSAAHWPLLYHAMRLEDSLDLVRCLLDHGADPNAVWSRDWTPLFAAAYHGNPEQVHLLLGYGARPNALIAGCLTAMPLYGAVWSRNVEILRALLESGADPNLMTNPTDALHPLSAAVYGNFVEGVRLLLDAGASPRSYPAVSGQTWLDYWYEYAESNNRTEIARMLQELANG